ncbi:hypothetical protein [Anaerotignum propionicum]
MCRFENTYKHCSKDCSIHAKSNFRLQYRKQVLWQ